MENRRRPGISSSLRYYIKYIGVVDDSMGILTRGVDLNASLLPKPYPNKRRTLSLLTREDITQTTYRANPSFKECEIGLPNPTRYATPAVTSYLNTARLPFFRRPDAARRVKDYESIERVECKEKRKGLQGCKLTKRLSLTLQKIRKVNNTCDSNIDWEMLPIMTKAAIQLHKRQTHPHSSLKIPKRVVLKLKEPIVLWSDNKAGSNKSFVCAY